MKLRIFLFFFLAFFIFSSLLAQKKNTNNTQSQQDLAEFVSPFVGTDGHGHTYPGATAPFGMVQLSPDTRLTGWDGCSGYHYSDSVMYGFSHTHLSGTGCSDYGDILIMPTVGDLKFKSQDYASPFSHANETAQPGYYSVLLDKYKVRAELTATSRAGFHRYGFPKTKNANIIIDLEHRDEVIESSIEVVGNSEIRGMRRSKAWAKDQYVYFVIKFSEPFRAFGLVSKNAVQLGETQLKGKNLKGYATFETDGKKPILVKVGISAVDYQGAVQNMASEIPQWDFERVKSETRDLWNKELNKIQVEGGTTEQQKTFYTALYHVMLAPNLYNDVDGRFRGTDLKIHQADSFQNYTVFSLWDTYRAAHPLFSIIDTKRTQDFINTFLAQYDNGGLLPVWELSGNETFCMIGYHSVSVIADAYMKNIKHFDAEHAYEAMKHSANMRHFGLDAYRRYGFVPFDVEHESVSKTLEYAYDDWCIAQMALSLGHEADYEIYIKRAQYYKNLFDPSTGFLRAKVNGNWYSPFRATEVNNNYTEANAWQYAFYVPQDIEGLAEMMGGRDIMLNKLDELFTTTDNVSGREQADITGLIGQYAHGNEPSHHIAYLYNYVGMPWKTQERVRYILDNFYSTKADGLIGNEDCGQMSAWYVMSAMGIYPVCPGLPEYAIGSPIFSKVTIKLENGNSFVIKANNVSDKNKYIQIAQLNGQAYNRCYLRHADIMQGGEISFRMDETPNMDWANRESDVPYSSIKDHLLVPTPVIVSESKTFKTQITVSIKAVTENTDIYYTTDNREPDSTSMLYTEPFTVNKNMSVKAIAYQKDKGKSFPITANFYKIPDTWRISIHSKYDKQYSAGGPEGLIDGLRGQSNWRTGGWQGYQSQDFEATLDLGSEQVFHKISAGFLQDVDSWILMPTEVEFSVSSDNSTFEVVGKIKNEVPAKEYGNIIKDFQHNANMKGRYVKVKAKNFGQLPEWHLGAGGDAYIFIDEIMVE